MIMGRGLLPPKEPKVSAIMLKLVRTLSHESPLEGSWDLVSSLVRGDTERELDRDRERARDRERGRVEEICQACLLSYPRYNCCCKSQYHCCQSAQTVL